MGKIEVALNARAKLGECPRWDEKEQVLYWTDINAFQLHRYNPLTGEDDYLQFQEEIGCFSLRINSGFVLAMRSGFYFLDGWNTQLRAVCDPEVGLEKNRFNDGRCDAAGRFIAGSYYPPKDYEGASFWSLGTDLKTSKLIGGLLTSNGAAFSPDNNTFYYSDTPKHVIYKCRYDLNTGSISAPEVFHQFPYGNGRPDGASVDQEGNYWTALYEGGRIACLNPEGGIIKEVSVPARCPTMVAFGGADMKTLFVTSAGERPSEELKKYSNPGDIMKLRVDVPGLKEYRFAG